MTIDTAHLELCLHLRPELVEEEDALALMLLLHTHEIELSSPSLSDRPNVTLLAPVTQRHAAEVVGELLRNDVDDTVRDARYWYVAFNQRTPYEVLEDAPDELQNKVRHLRDALLRNECVTDVRPE